MNKKWLGIFTSATILATTLPLGIFADDTLEATSTTVQASSEPLAETNLLDTSIESESETVTSVVESVDSELPTSESSVETETPTETSASFEETETIEETSELPTEATQTTTEVQADEPNANISNFLKLPYTVEQINQQAQILTRSQLWPSLESLTADEKSVQASQTIDASTQSYQVTEKILLADQIYYNLLVNKQLTGYVAAEALVFTEEVDQYVTLFAEETLYQDLSTKTSVSKNVRNQTFLAKERYTTAENQIYLSLFDQQQFVGYLEEKEQPLTSDPLGQARSINVYVTMLKTEGAAEQKQTYLAKESYYHFNGKEYLALYHNNQFVANVEKNNTKAAAGAQGDYISYGKYVTVTKANQTIFQNFAWQTRNNTSNVLNKTFLAKGMYQHTNGSRYLSLYDNQNNWLGYVKDDAVTVANGRQGTSTAYNKYVTLTRQNYPIWQNFSWVEKNNTTNLLHQTYLAKEVYQHFNGSRYLALYHDNQLIGYVNANAARVGNGKQGAYVAYDKYVTVHKNNYPIWQNFAWQEKNHSSKVLNKTFLAKGIYYHANGSRYLSLYDSNNQWAGYINSNATKIANGKQGIYHSYNKNVRVKDSYTIWRDFSFQNKVSGSFAGKTYLAKGYYDHMNGKRYLSLYNNNTWIGYINETDTTLSRGAATYLGITREDLLTELNTRSWMYLGTPFRGSLFIPDSVMSPIGNPNPLYGPGFNCTGFVATALKYSGGNLNKIIDVTRGIGGPANAYNWRDALTPRTDYSTFSSISALLNSGKARKGDIIYFEADFSKPNPDPHIGFFWGESPSHNLIWHSTVGGGGNARTQLFSGTPYSKILLIPMD